MFRWLRAILFPNRRPSGRISMASPQPMRHHVPCRIGRRRTRSQDNDSRRSEDLFPMPGTIPFLIDASGGSHHDATPEAPSSDYSPAFDCGSGGDCGGLD